MLQTPFLQVCMCQRKPEPGTTCLTCGCHAHWTESNNIVEVGVRVGKGEGEGVGVGVGKGVGKGEGEGEGEDEVK